MAQTDRQNGVAQSDAQGCQTAKKLLEQVTSDIAKFEAQKLAEFKSQLEAFIKNQDTVVADYKAKYDGLRKAWYDRQNDLQTLCNQLKCEFPPSSDYWKTLIQNCICTRVHDLCCLEQRIAARKRCSAGPLQRKRDEAQAKFDAAKKRLDWTTTLAASIDAILKDNQKLVLDIGKTPATERPVAIYLLIKLRQAQLGVAPWNASPECLNVCQDWDPNKLCESVFATPWVDEVGCAPKDGDATAGNCKQWAKPAGPSIISPDAYCNALDAAWHDYNDAKQTLAKAIADFSAAPDDIDSLVKKFGDDTKGLDDAIKKCLKDATPPKGGCSDGSSPQPAGGGQTSGGSQPAGGGQTSGGTHPGGGTQPYGGTQQTGGTPQTGGGTQPGGTQQTGCTDQSGAGEQQHGTSQQSAR